MKTSQDSRQQIRAGPPSPVTPEGRAVSVESPPGAPRRLATRRPLVHRHDGSCCVHKSPQMHPSAFARLLRASSMPAVSGAGLGPSGAASATGTPAGGGHELEAAAHMRLAVPSGFVVGFTGVEDDPFSDSPTGSIQRSAGTAAPVTATMAVDVRDEETPTADITRQYGKESMVKFLAFVAAAVVVAAEAIAAAPGSRDATPATPAVSAASKDGGETL